jgi:hypothetical protein
MRRVLQRFEARCFRFWGERGASIACMALALYFAWEAMSVCGPRATIADGPLDAAAQALSIMSVGRVTFEAAPKLLWALDVMLALALLCFASSRMAAVVVALRGFLAMAPLVMLRADLFSAFPLRPNALGWGTVARGALCGAAWLAISRERWQYLQVL